MGVQLILEGDAARGFGVDITEFSEVPVDETPVIGVPTTCNWASAFPRTHATTGRQARCDPSPIGRQTDGGQINPASAYVGCRSK